MIDGRQQRITTRSGTSITMLTAPNAGPKTLDGTNTYVVGTRPAVLIDPGPDDGAWIDALVAWLRAESIHPRAILLSHQHPDHMGGAERLRDLLRVPLWASLHYQETLFEPAEPDFTYGPDSEFYVDEEVLRVIEAPGHSSDHVVFWLEESGVLFSGDTLLGRGSTLIAPPEGDMQRYMRTLQRIRALEPYAIAPGHGPMVEDPDAAIAAYIRHREERDRQILDALRHGPATVQNLVDRLYVDVDPSVLGLAAGSVAATLEKLRREGRVWNDGDTFLIAT
jgi:glyoxylase-like metal-dependent hydrolase (beta-lactamase superfamily II)